MQLIEGEKLAAVKALIDHEKGGTEHEFVGLTSAGIHELHSNSRRLVAEIWNSHFL